jgi:hypothetical protein
MAVLGSEMTSGPEGGVMPGEAGRSPVLERLEAAVGERVTHATVGGREVARGRTTVAFELTYWRSGASGRCPR